MNSPAILTSITDKKIVSRYWLVLFIMLIAFVITAPNNPLTLKIPNRDSGVFLYMGNSILEGQVPYRDVWDHKPPVIFYLNAFGLLIGGGSPWGVWAIEVIFLILAAWVGFRLLDESIDRFAAFFGTLLWLGTYTLLWIRSGGNFAEEYALFFQFLLLYLFYRAENRGSYNQIGVMIGISAAICFFLKPNIIGITVGIIVFIFLSRIREHLWNRLIRDLLSICSGFVGISVGICLYFYVNGALFDFFDAVFRFNFIYTDAGFLERLQSILSGLSITLFSGLSIIIIISWFAGFFLIFRRKPEQYRLDSASYALLSLALIALPLEFIFSTLSGRPEDHYYLVWLPVYAVFAGFFTILFPAVVLKKEKNLLGLSLILIVCSLFPIVVKITRWSNMLNKSNHQDGQELVEYIHKNSEPGDFVLLWGAETTYNFLTSTKSPSRYVYQYPLLTEGYSNQEMIDEFIQDLKDTNPQIIIDTHAINPNWPSLESEEIGGNFRPLVEFIEQKYKKDSIFNSLNSLGLVSYRCQKCDP